MRRNSAENLHGPSSSTDNSGRAGSAETSDRVKGIAPDLMPSKMSPVALPPTSDLPSTKCCASDQPLSEVAIFSICASSICASESRRDLACVWCARNDSSAIRQYGCLVEFEISLTG